jgi:hypothetical protein
LEIDRSTLKTFNNRRGVFSTFFKFAFHRGWTVENTILRVPHHRVRIRRGSAATFSAEQARKLMEFAETHEGGRWVPYFAICLFAGVRPGVPDGEITKLHPERICLESGGICIPDTVSKIREARRITIQPNLAARLRAYPLDKYPLVVGNFKKRRQPFRDRVNLTHDVLRHTFISMFVAKFRSIGEAAIQAGNSESIIRKHYLDLKTVTEAEEFFSILPSRKLTPAVGASNRASLAPMVLPATVPLPKCSIRILLRLSGVLRLPPMEAALFRELPGAGKGLAPRLAAAFGTDRSHWTDAESVGRYIGVLPVLERSGGRQWVHWRWCAPNFLRQTFVDWAKQTVRYSAWAGAYCEHCKRRGKRPQSIYRSLATKWIRILWRSWTDRVPYDDARYCAALKAAQSPLHDLLQAA